ncbi:MAG: DUF1631 domain-containing protein [Proteobacteria bacterium]|nr:DUF1631 domain-containing protein [Pseudomonadota bacterium]
MSETGSHASNAASDLATLSSRALPRRVRTLLEGIFELVADEVDRGLTATLDGIEQQLFKMADQVRSNEMQLRCLEALGTIKHGRFDLMPRFVALLESELALVRESSQRDQAALQAISYNDLELVAEADLDETTLLHEIAARAESKVSLPLFLLSQRFGVIAGKPALDATALPVGPTMLCRHLRRASQCFELLPEHRQLLFRQFERHVLLGYPSLIDRVNAYLVHQGVLPHLAYVPPRHKPGARAEEAPAPAPPQRVDERSRTGGRATSPAHVAAESGMARPTAFTGWPGDAIGIPGALPQRRAEDAIYTNLRDMLHNARGIPPAGASVRPQGPGAVSASDVQSMLGLLQRRPQTSISVNGQMRPPSVTHIKQDLLAQLRQVTGADVAPVLASEDTDTIDLVGMLFDQIMKDVRPNSTAAHLLSRLQVPLLRVALSDKAFFSQQEHPARQMLDAVAETGAYWAGEDAADRELIGNVERLVGRISQEFDGDISLFNTLLSELAGQTQTVMRRAELAERRHVEAAQGREKLAVAQAHATRIMHEITTAHPVPKFTRTLLTQAWTDVLALTALRHGEDSDEWRHQVEIANQIATTASISVSGDAEHGLPEDPEQAAALSEHVERSLMQVGYHAEEAAAIGQRLGAGEAEGDDNASRTELALKMKHRGRLGEAAAVAADEAELPVLTAHEQRCLERIRDLPFGTWLEFITNQQGDSVRRRLSWFSPITGHCLFINHRGQKIGDHTLDSLARAMARNQVRIIEPKRESLLDRALHRVRDLLRSPADATHETGAKA